MGGRKPDRNGGKQEIKAITEERKGEENREVEGCVFVGYVVLWLGILILVLLFLLFVCQCDVVLFVGFDVCIFLFLLSLLMSVFFGFFCWLKYLRSLPSPGYLVCFLLFFPLAI